LRILRKLKKFYTSINKVKIKKNYKDLNVITLEDEGLNMKFPPGTIFKDSVDPETGEKIKIAILPDGSKIKFWTDEDLTEI
jgi:hypothetical protein